jgi:hypothetical protein
MDRRYELFRVVEGRSKDRERSVMRASWWLLKVLGVGLVMTGGLLWEVAPGWAFEQSVTCGPAPNPYACEAGQSPAFVHWDTRCVTLYINDSGSKDVDVVTFAEVTQRSIGAWNAVACSDFTLAYGGTTREARVGYFKGEKNANVLMFRDTGWVHGRGVLALTSVTYDINTGRIVDADIEFNSQSYRYTTTEAAVLVQIDLMNTMVHELGHFLGLDHSAEAEATMFASAPIGETQKRTLSADDEAGLCAVYAKAGAGVICPAVEVGVFEPGQSAGVDDGCAVVGVRRRAWGGSDGWMTWGVVACGLVAGLRRRRRHAAGRGTQ